MDQMRTEKGQTQYGLLSAGFEDSQYTIRRRLSNEVMIRQSLEQYSQDLIYRHKVHPFSIGSPSLSFDTLTKHKA